MKNRLTITFWIIRTTILLGLIIVVWYVYMGASDARLQVQLFEKALEKQPEEKGKLHMLENDLEQHSQDIERIRSLIVKRENLVDVIARIEAAGSAHNATINVPNVEEVEQLDEDGKPIKQTGLVQDVRIRIAGTASPENILSFLHAVEHMPYLIILSSWHIDAERAGTTLGSVGRAPEGRGSQLPIDDSFFEAEVILSVYR